MNGGMLTVSNNEFGKLDILIEDGKELFPATECAKLLGYTNPYGAVQKHCRSLSKREVPHPQNPEKTASVNFINEGDLWRLIIRSRLPSAQKFEKWLFDEVLPELRKTGGYRMKPAANMPYTWIGRGCIRIDDAAKLLGVKKDKLGDMLRKRETVYVRGVDWETLRGYELDEFKFYNRVQTPGKGITVIYESGFAKLRWELLGEGTPDGVMQLPEAPLALPAAVQVKQEKLERGMEQIQLILEDMKK